MSVDLAPVQRRLLSEAVFERLVGEILSGALAAGDALPSERALSEAFDVNRHAVREAIKRLQQAGLVRVAQGGATRVQDWRRSAGLDVIADIAAAAKGEARQELLLAVAEMRASIGAEVARLCAQARVQGLEDEVAGTGGPYAHRAEAYAHFWERIVDGAGNIAYRLAFNSLVAAQRTGRIDARIYASEVDDPEAQRELAGAIARGDAARAHSLARALLDRTLEAMR